MVYDVKMENFQRKARLIAGGHMTEVSSATMIYASVLSRELGRITLTLAALNNLEVNTADIKNAYLTAPIGWCTLSPEFGGNAGRRSKLAGAPFWNHLADCMRHLGWELRKADQEVWIKPEVREDDGQSQ